MSKKIRRIAIDQHEIAHEYGLFLDGREIFLNGEIDSDGHKGIEFVKNLRMLVSSSTSKPIVIHQHSIGGDWCAGIMIHDAIATCESPVIMICHGIVASMGTVIATACVKHDNSIIISMPNCDWLLHEGNVGISEDLTKKQSKALLEWEDLISKKMIEWYSTCLKSSELFENKTKKQIINYIQNKFDKKGDWWLSSKESIEYGFCDAILGDEGYESIEDLKSYFQE